MNNYNVNVHPLLTNYNHTNQDGVNPLSYIYSTDNHIGVSEIRGSGNYNPAPNYPQTTDNGNAYSDIKIQEQHIYKPNEGNIDITPFGAAQIDNTWNTNTLSELDLSKNNPGKSDYKDTYDEYQNYAYKSTRLNDPYLLPYYFSKINVHFIQNNVIKHVKESRNITVETKQDVSMLLNMMVGNYLEVYNSQGVFLNSPRNDISKDTGCSFRSILGNLNKITIEQYVKSIMSTLNMTEYYLNDISTLPMPLDRPGYTLNKGTKELGFVGHFEDNHKFTNAINSYNGRDVLPGVIDSTIFGN